MSNKFPSMSIVDQMKQKSDQEKQLAMQHQSMILQTRLRLSESFLNTLIGRLDVDLTKADQVDPLCDMSIEFANTLMIKLGMIVIETKGVE